MRFRTWPVAALGLGGLLLLIVVSLLAASRRAQEIYTQLDRVNAHHRAVEAKLRRLRSDVHLSSIFIRDYLLDQDRERAAEYRKRLTELRRTNLATLGELQALEGGVAESHPIVSLRAKLEDYWQAFVPLFDWTPSERITQSAEFLRREVLPRREAVLTIASGIEELNNASLAAERAEVTRWQAAFYSGLQTLLWQSLLLGLAVAVVAVMRLRVLERRSETEHAIAAEAEGRMRQLSQQLVATQEEERKKLSRELHDHVGQTLTALRMELGRIERLRVPADSGVPEAVMESRKLVDELVRTVRDLALGLRPSMLDDFGLQAALEWHVRDFTRRFGLLVDLTVKGHVETLPEPHRTCIYRIVQEALTNCVRHSGARHIRVAVTSGHDGLAVTIGDNGMGMDVSAARNGLGLRGIEERVRELSGTMSIASRPSQGTTLTVHLPAPAGTEEVAFARAAG